MLISNRLKNLIMLYCLGLLMAACTIIFIIDGKNSNNDPDNIEDIPVTQAIADNDITPEPDPVVSTAPSVPTPTPLVLVGATECWKQFADELNFDWSPVSDKSSVLFRKPQSSGEKITGHITGSDGRTVTVKLENCLYTEFYATSLERRAMDHYYNDAPPVGAVADDDGDLVSTLDPNNVSSDIFGDPLRKLSSMTLKESDGSYSVTLSLKFDQEYSYTLYETESFFLIVLDKVANDTNDTEINE